MKKYLSIYTLLALTCIVLQSCLFSEEEIFDESGSSSNLVVLLLL